MLKKGVAFFIFFFHIVAYSAAPLPAEQAFSFHAYLDKQNQLVLQWDIAPGYYLYRNQLAITAAATSEIKINAVELPAGVTKKDTLHGDYQVYSDSLKLPIVVLGTPSGLLDLSIHYQGCSVKGFCYAPIQKNIRVNLSQVQGPQDLTKKYVFSTEKVHHKTENTLTTLFEGNSPFFIVLSFFGFGLLLAFTPCVLPMVPILSGIIIGLGHHVSVKKAFLLSFFYVIGMAITYAMAGMLVALAGSHIQTLFQQTWIIVLFSGLFVILALSLFGYFEIELPARWQHYITAMSNQQKGGTYLGVFLMGVLSTLIVSPCVSAPLVGVLTYIAQTGNVMLGGVTLLAMGLGMGAPLLLLGISAGKVLPKTGAWMESVKKFFGIIMLGFAIWMLSRVIPGPLVLMLWSILAICTAVFLGVFSESPTHWQKVSRGVGVFLLIYGVILLSGAALGNANPFSPWETSTQQSLNFVTLKDSAQLDAAFTHAQKKHQPVLLDFYADWCVSCVKMDKEVLTQPDVQDALKHFVLLRADVTQNNAFDQAVLKKFNVIAPPTILFFDQEGQEYQRIVGEVDAQQFIKKLK